MTGKVLDFPLGKAKLGAFTEVLHAYTRQLTTAMEAVMDLMMNAEDIIADLDARGKAEESGKVVPLRKPLSQDEAQLALAKISAPLCEQFQAMIMAMSIARTSDPDASYDSLKDVADLMGRCIEHQHQKTAGKENKKQKDALYKRLAEWEDNEGWFFPLPVPVDLADEENRAKTMMFRCTPGAADFGQWMMASAIGTMWFMILTDDKDFKPKIPPDWIRSMAEWALETGKAILLLIERHVARFDDGNRRFHLVSRGVSPGDEGRMKFTWTCLELAGLERQLPGPAKEDDSKARQVSEEAARKVKSRLVDAGGLGVLQDAIQLYLAFSSEALGTVTKAKRLSAEAIKQKPGSRKHESALLAALREIHRHTVAMAQMMDIARIGSSGVLQEPDSELRLIKQAAQAAVSRMRGENAPSLDQLVPGLEERMDEWAKSDPCTFPIPVLPSVIQGGICKPIPSVVRLPQWIVETSFADMKLKALQNAAKSGKSRRPRTQRDAIQPGPLLEWVHAATTSMVYLLQSHVVRFTGDGRAFHVIASNITEGRKKGGVQVAWTIAELDFIDGEE